MNKQSDDYELDRLDAAVQAVLAEPVPQDAVERVKAQASRLGATTATTKTPRAWTAVWHSRWARYGGLAAAVLLFGAFTVSTLLVNGMSVRAFAEVVQNAVQAHSLQVTVIQRLGKRPETVDKLYMKDNKVRVEGFGEQLVMIGDLESREVLYLAPEQKLAQASTIDARAVFDNPIDQLRGIKPDDAEYVGEEYLGEFLARVYRIKRDVLGIKSSESDMIVWVDPTSGLPMRIVNHDFDASVQLEIRFEDFVWNEPLSPTLFSLEFPEGYQAGTVVVTSPPAPPKKPAPPSSIDPAKLSDGVLSDDRVPRRIVWGPDSATITATMDDPETMDPLQRQLEELRQWNVETGELNWSVVAGSSFSLAASNDGKWLASIKDDELQLRDPQTGKVTKEWSTEKSLSPLAFSPDGKMLAAGICEWGEQYGGVGQEEGGVQLWNLEQGAVVKSFPDNKPTTFVRFSKDGKYLANSSNGGPIKVWDPTTGELARMFPCGDKFDFSPDGKFIACMASRPLPGDTPDDVKKRYDVQVYELQTGKLSKTLIREEHTKESWVLWIEYSSDGKYLATANWDGSVKLWSVDSGELVKTITTHDAGVHTVVFAPAGNTFASGSEDGTLRLWNVDELMSGE